MSDPRYDAELADTLEAEQRRRARKHRELDDETEARLSSAAPRFVGTHFDFDSHLRRVLEVVRRAKGAE